jgi:hypothetical protein
MVRSVSTERRTAAVPVGGATADNDLIAVRFTDADELIGMDVLVTFGPVQAFPGAVFICERSQLKKALPALRKRGVTEVAVRDDVGALNLRDGRHLAEAESWCPVEEPAHGKRRHSSVAG